MLSRMFDFSRNICFFFFPSTAVSSLRRCENACVRRWRLDSVYHQCGFSATSTLLLHGDALSPDLHCCQYTMLMRFGRLFANSVSWRLAGDDFIAASSVKTGEVRWERRQTFSAQFLRRLRSQMWSRCRRRDAGVVMWGRLCASIPLSVFPWLVITL